MQVLMLAALMMPLAIGCSGEQGQKLPADTGTEADPDPDQGCETGTVSGTVTDASDWDIQNGQTGNIQPNARVLAEDETGFNFETVAEADGSFELELDAGTWTLSAGPDSSCFGDETEVDIGCDPATVDLSVISCMGR
jgi:hypothetical protein